MEDNMRTFRDIEVSKTIIVTKKDFKNLGKVLSEHELIDDRNLWFAGFDNYKKSSNNAVAENLFYGNKKLKIMSINSHNEVYYINNSKEGLKARVLGSTNDKFKISSFSLSLHPTVNIVSPDGFEFEIKVTKNKKIVKEFKKSFK